MYEFLEGRVVEHSATRLVLAVGGVGYELAIPLGQRPAEGDPTRVWTHLVVRDDAHLLYGFSDKASRDLFRLLLLVRGVGPSAALALLSGLSGRELLEAVAAGDPKPLTRVKGVGAKTAQQILLDLADRVGQLAARLPGHVSASGVLQPMRAPDEEQHLADATSALISIGFGEREARKQVERAAEKVGADDLERLVRAALETK